MRLIDADKLKELIDSAPEIEHSGKWEHGGEKDWIRIDGSPIFLQCSECHGIVLNNGAPEWNYCPKCGARMGA